MMKLSLQSIPKRFTPILRQPPQSFYSTLPKGELNPAHKSSIALPPTKEPLPIDHSPPTEIPLEESFPKKREGFVLPEEEEIAKVVVSPIAPPPLPLAPSPLPLPPVVESVVEPVRRPVGGFRGGLIGFLLGSTLVGKPHFFPSLFVVFNSTIY